MSQSKVGGTPVISSLEPDGAVVTWEGSVEIGGSGFDDGSWVLFAGVRLQTRFKSDSLLEVDVTQAVTGTTGIKTVQVYKKAGDVSNEVHFLVVPG